MPLPELPTFDFDLEEIREYVKSHFDDFDHAIAYLEYVQSEYEEMMSPALDEFDRVNEEFYSKYQGDVKVPDQEMAHDVNAAIEVGRSMVDYDEFILAIKSFINELILNPLISTMISWTR